PPQKQHMAMVTPTPSPRPLTPPQSRTAADNLPKVYFDRDIFVLNTLQPVPFPQVLHKRDPSEGRELQYRRGDQHRDPGPILSDQLLLKRRAGSEPQPFFMRQIVQ